MKPIRLTQNFEDLPAGLVFQPVSVHAWATTHNGRLRTIKREDFDEDDFTQYFEPTTNGKAENTV